MRRQHQRHESNMFASTRIAVALCAAIAMVLGAMSVGANRRDNQALLDTPVAAAGPTLTNRESTPSTDNSNETDNELPLGESFSAQQPLTVNPPVKQQVLLVNPKKPQTDISLGPIKTLINEEKLHIELDVPVPALVSLVPPVPVDTPVVTIDAPSTLVTDPVNNVLDSPLLQPTGEATEALTPLVSSDDQPLP